MTINKKETQRQLPKVKKYTGNNLYTDMLYGYLQTICEVQDNNVKFIPKSAIKYTHIARDLEISRQTASTKFKNLLTLGLIQEIDNGYEILTLPNNEAFLLSLSTLRKLVTAVKERTISIYVYLLNRFIANQEQSYEFSITSIKEYIGISVECTTNNYIITDILDVLSDMQLIKYSSKTKRQENGQLNTIYTLDYATNKLPSDC